MSKSKDDKPILKPIAEIIKKEKSGIMKNINWETVKTVVIAILITAIVAFVLGMKYQRQYNNSVKAEAKELSSVVSRDQSKQ